MDFAFAGMIFNVEIEATSTAFRVLSKVAQLTQFPPPTTAYTSRYRAVFLIQNIVTGRGELVNYKTTPSPSVTMLKLIVAFE